MPAETHQQSEPSVSAPCSTSLACVVGIDPARAADAPLANLELDDDLTILHLWDAVTDADAESSIITLYNETYSMPPMPDAVVDGIVRGLYPFLPSPRDVAHPAQILASGTAMRAALEAQRLLADEHDVRAGVRSATSFRRPRKVEVDRWNRLHPAAPPHRSYLEEVLAGVAGPSSCERLREAVPDQIGRWGPRPFEVLGTDGSACPIGERRFAATSKSTRPASSWLACAPWPCGATSRRTRSRTPSSATASTPMSWTRERSDRRSS